MKYYDPSTRKRPDFNELCMSFTNPTYGRMGLEVFAVTCKCGDMLCNKPVIFDHWQQGHFDVYDEVREKSDREKGFHAGGI